VITVKFVLTKQPGFSGGKKILVWCGIIKKKQHRLLFQKRTPKLPSRGPENPPLDHIPFNTLRISPRHSKVKLIFGLAQGEEEDFYF